MKLIENLVTVVIPCYNDGAFIIEAVDSILNQTFQDFHIVIIDDGSNDTTKIILKEIKGDNITVIYQKNQGVSAARNKAISLSDSKFILTLDADDYFEPTFLEKALREISNDKSIGVVGSYYTLFGDCFEEKKTVKPIGGKIKNFLVKNEGIASCLFKRECWEQVGGYDKKMKLGYEDWEFWIAILSKSWEMKIIKETLFNYRIKSVSRDQIATNHHDLVLKKYILNKHRDVFKEHSELVISSLLVKNEYLRKTSLQYKNSLECKLGKVIVEPFKCVKNILNKLK
jgi:glycosyltransferase involved in cell wall biosynthesis